MTVVFARFVNVLRQLNGVVAGTVRMDWRRFLAFNALGGTLWVLAWTVAGFHKTARDERSAMIDLDQMPRRPLR